MLYMLVSAFIVGLVPYYPMDHDTPISSAFASHGILGPILMAMAIDDLLPSFCLDVNNRTQGPTKSTILSVQLLPPQHLSGMSSSWQAWYASCIHKWQYQF